MSREAVRCPRRNCGAFMESGTNGQGVVILTCPPCALNRRGLCRECGSVLHAANRRNTLRCTRCAKRHALRLDRDYDRARYARRRSVELARHAAWRSDPDNRERKRRYMAAYRAKHPRDNYDRACQRVYMQLRRQSPAYRARQNARKRARRAARNAETRKAA